MTNIGYETTVPRRKNQEKDREVKHVSQTQSGSEEWKENLGNHLWKMNTDEEMGFGTLHD